MKAQITKPELISKLLSHRSWLSPVVLKENRKQYESMTIDQLLSAYERMPKNVNP